MARGDELITLAVTDAQGYRAVFVKSEPHFADEMRAWRDATETRASVTALIMLSIYRALRDAGVPLAQVCEVVVDLRRFLPGEAQTLSNFCTVARCTPAPALLPTKTSARNSARGPNRPERS